jgi:hypothetical protein
MNWQNRERLGSRQIYYIEETVVLTNYCFTFDRQSAQPSKKGKDDFRSFGRKLNVQ